MVTLSATSKQVRAITEVESASSVSAEEGAAPCQTMSAPLQVRSLNSCRIFRRCGFLLIKSCGWNGKVVTPCCSYCCCAKLCAIHAQLGVQLAGVGASTLSPLCFMEGLRLLGCVHSRLTKQSSQQQDVSALLHRGMS